MELNDGINQMKFRGNEELVKASGLTVRGVLNTVIQNLNPSDPRPSIYLGNGDPSSFSSFRTPSIAEDAIVDALFSAKFNGYSSNVGILPARKAVADYLSRDLPYKLSPDDVFLTLGCTQAIEAALSALARPGTNILLPRPGFPFYEARAAFSHLEARHFDLIPEKGWEVDLDAVKSLADEKTVAMVIINPGNPCGNVYSHQHLKNVAETARKLGILVIADEVYDHLTFGGNPFIPMGVFGSIVPVLTLGSISKRWIVPGWRFGWLALTDPDHTLRKTGFVNCIQGFLNVCSDPVTFIQGAIPRILEISKENSDFFSKIVGLLRQDADICYEMVNEIPCIMCPYKPQGSMFAMVKLNFSLLDDSIQDDTDFCNKLAKEESVIVLPGVAVGLKGWVRLTFALEPSALEEALDRMKAFCMRHIKD